MSAETLIIWSRYAGIGGLALLIFILLLPWSGIAPGQTFLLNGKIVACTLILGSVLMQWTLSGHMLLYVSLMLVVTGGCFKFRHWWKGW